MSEHAQHYDIAGHRSADDQYLETPPGAGYEHTDANIGVMVKFGFWLIISAIVVHVGLGLMYWLLIRQSTARLDTREYPLAVNDPPHLPAEPRLQQFPRNEFYEFRMKEDAVLNRYGWVDKNAGTVHIPIEDAMRIMVERGLLSREQDASQPVPPGLMPSDASSGRVMEGRR
jgi:hypothetical protein